MTDLRTPARIGVMSSALPGWAPADVCAAAAEAGAEGIEWGVGADQAIIPGDPGVQRLADACGRRALACAGLAVQDADGLRYPAETWRRLAEHGRALGAPHIRVFAPPVHPANVGAGLETLRSRLAGCAAVVARAGLRLLLEPAPRTLTPGPDLARRALTAAEPGTVGVVYDPGNMAQEGWLDPRLALGLFGPMLRHVHVKNVAPVRAAGSWGWRPATLEEGFVDWIDVFEALHEARYGGWLVLDHLSGRADAAVLAADVARVRRLTSEVVAP